MSGGVDSSVAAHLTLQAGYTGIGCTMRLYDNADAGLPEDSRTCCTLDDTEDARSVAFRLGMPFYVFNFTAEFRQRVIQPFAQSYLRGETPNPCIECNRCLKFERLMHRAAELGCEKLVTGHYAQVIETDSGFELHKAADRAKDQSYVLYMLTQAQLSHLLLPLGGMTKEQVRQIAEREGFVNAHKRDSQDICFVPDGDYARVVERTVGASQPHGEFVDTKGNVLGEHQGILHYTVGQRRRLGLSLGKVQYVCGIDAEHNRVVIGDHADLFSDTAEVRAVSWVAGHLPEEPLRCSAKIRYRHTEQPCLLTPVGENRVRLKFDAPQRAVTAGQAAVFYDGDRVLGGGTIVGT